MLHIFLFGMLELCQDGERLPPLPTQKITSLFGYLVTRPRQQHPREILAEIFWPDVQPRQSHSSLNTAVWQIRAVLKNGRLNPDHYLQAGSKSICWQPSEETWVDVESFERGCAQKDAEALEQAAGLYRSPFLDNIFDDWCLEQRYRLEGQYQGLLMQLLNAYQRSEQHHKVLTTAKRLLMIEPLYEEAVFASMMSHYCIGNRAAAVQCYQAWRRKLNSELGIEPARGLRELYDQVLAESAVQTGLGRLGAAVGAGRD